MCSMCVNRAEAILFVNRLGRKSGTFLASNFSEDIIIQESVCLSTTYLGQCYQTNLSTQFQYFLNLKLSFPLYMFVTL